MKINRILPLIFLSLFLTSCRQPDGDFMMGSPVIINKEQNSDDKKCHQAYYTIQWLSGSGTKYTTKLVLSEKFGNANDYIRFSADGKMYASQAVEKE